VLVGVAAVSESGDPYTMAGPLEWAWLIAFASVPFAFVWALLHNRLHSAGAMSELVERLGEPYSPGRLQDALVAALGDQFLMLAYWSPVGRGGTDTGRPPPASSRARTQCATVLLITPGQLGGTAQRASQVKRFQDLHHLLRTLQAGLPRVDDKTPVSTGRSRQDREEIR
jgi:hypothetical protein